MSFMFGTEHIIQKELHNIKTLQYQISSLTSTHVFTKRLSKSINLLSILTEKRRDSTYRNLSSHAFQRNREPIKEQQHSIIPYEYRSKSTGNRGRKTDVDESTSKTTNPQLKMLTAFVDETFGRIISNRARPHYPKTFSNSSEAGRESPNVFMTCLYRDEFYQQIRRILRQKRTIQSSVSQRIYDRTERALLRE